MLTSTDYLRLLLGAVAIMLFVHENFVDFALFGFVSLVLLRTMRWEDLVPRKQQPRYHMNGYYSPHHMQSPKMDEPLMGFSTVLVMLEKPTTPTELFESLGSYEGTYDFVKMPYDPSTKTFRQIGIINFKSKAEAQVYRRSCNLSTKWASYHGYEQCVDSLGKGVMHVPLELQPIVLVDGKRADLAKIIKART